MSNVLSKAENLEKGNDVWCNAGEKRVVAKRVNTFKSTRVSKLRPEAAKLDLKDNNSGDMDKNVIIFPKIKKMAGSRQIHPFEKLDKEIATIAKMLSMFYRSPEAKKKFKQRKEIVDSIRQTSSLMEKLKKYQSQTGKRDLDGILSSFYFQVAKLSSTIANLEKEMKKVQQVEYIPAKNLFQSEQTLIGSEKVDNIPKLTAGSDLNFNIRIGNILRTLSTLRDSQAVEVNKLISDIERLKNNMSKEKQIEAPETENSDEAKKINHGNSNLNKKKLNCTRDHNLNENSNKDETQKEKEGLHLSQNKTEPIEENKASQDQKAPSDNWLQRGAKLSSRKEPSSSGEQEKSGSTSNSKRRRRNVSAKTRQNSIQGSSSDSWWRRGSKPSSEKDPPSSGIKGTGANTSDAESHVKIDAVAEEDSLTEKPVVDNQDKVAVTNVYVPPCRRGANYIKEEPYTGPRVIVIRQPRGPDGTKGFKKEYFQNFHETRDGIDDRSTSSGQNSVGCISSKPSSEKDPPSSGIKGTGANTSDAESHVKIDAVAEEDSLTEKPVVDNQDKVAVTNVYVPPCRRGANYIKEEPYTGPRVIVIRQPRGPDGTKGFKKEYFQNFHETRDGIDDRSTSSGQNSVGCISSKPSSEKDPPSSGIKDAGANTSDTENHVKIDAVTEEDSLMEKSVVENQDEVIDDRSTSPGRSSAGCISSKPSSEKDPPSSGIKDAGANTSDTENQVKIDPVTEEDSLMEKSVVENQDEVIDDRSTLPGRNSIGCISSEPSSEKDPPSCGIKDAGANTSDETRDGIDDRSTSPGRNSVGCISSN
ncbi:hypothetical protein QYM36_001917 [Artemia franciscana]|uniref:SUZ-C domain-containing protein n=1 Tax=Artemia franciscana TaxID=6661 RepID=A0AA88IFM3_ARTSF|nr:hypothetical protein QYM36_001917 [Artemia franciscana]